MKRNPWLVVAFSLSVAGCPQDVSVPSLPVADAGFDQVVLPTTEVTLDGSGSADPDGAALSYAWQLLARPAASAETLVAASSANPRLRLDVDGYYLVSLVVSNGERDSLPDTVALSASSATNFPPIAVARCAAPTSSGQTPHGAEGRVHGNQSTDPNGDPLTFQWTQVFVADCATCAAVHNCGGQPVACAPIAQAVTWTQQNNALGIFTAPSNGVGSLVFRVDVSDGTLTASDCVEFQSTNAPPFAIIETPPTSVAEGATFTLQGPLNPDSDQADWPSLIYQWSHTPGTVSVTYTASANAYPVSVEVHGITANTDITFTLAVNDPFAASDPCQFGSATCGRACCGQTVVTITDVALADNQACTFDSQCTSGNCECANANCTSRVCSPTACPCGRSNGSACTGNLNNNVDDPEDCTGSTGCGTPPCTCDGSGVCQ